MALTPSTLGDQRTRVRLLLQEPTSQYWTDVTLNAYINEAQFDIAVGCVPTVPTGMEEPLLATESFTEGVAGQEMYSLPPNYHGIRTVRCRLNANDTYRELPWVDVEFVRVHPQNVSGQPVPEAYFLWGESGIYQIGLYPAFISNTAVGVKALWISYWRKPDQLSSDGDALMIPPELHVANTYLAAHKAWLERSHQAEADKMLQMFNTEYTGKLAYIRRRQINNTRAVILGVIGDTNTERSIY